MPYCITRVEATPFPDAQTVDAALAAYATSIEDLTSLLASFVCSVPISADGGYQQHLADSLESYLREALTKRPGVEAASLRYSPSLGEKADLAVSIRERRSLYFEIEFRPNVEKDLVKFHIGHRANRLAVGILVLALNRGRLNPGYTSMPEYRKFSRVISEFGPQHPLLLLGIDGEHQDR